MVNTFQLCFVMFISTTTNVVYSTHNFFFLPPKFRHSKKFKKLNALAKKDIEMSKLFKNVNVKKDTIPGDPSPQQPAPQQSFPGLYDPYYNQYLANYYKEIPQTNFAEYYEQLSNSNRVHASDLQNTQTSAKSNIDSSYLNSSSNIVGGYSSVPNTAEAVSTGTGTKREPQSSMFSDGTYFYFFVTSFAANVDFKYTAGDFLW